MSPTTAPRPRPRRRPRAPGVLALLVVLVLGAAACSQARSETNEATPGATGPTTAAAGVPTTPTVPPEPDKLADPGIGPGECKVVTYTPPTASAPMPGELCRPKDHQRDVAVVVVHGGSGIGGSYANMRRWANRYLVEGYVTFLPEYHLFNVGGESPVFPKPEQNIKAAVQYLRGTAGALGIRRDRVVVQGQSAGARVGAVAYTTPNDPWFAGPELYPDLSDEVNGFIGFYHPFDGTMQFADQYFGGPEASTDPQVIARLDKADSLAHASSATGPALFIVGDKDWNIIIDQQNAFAEILHQKQLAATSVVVPGGAHGFDEGGSRLSKLGEESAVTTLTWLNDNFPQTPPRDAQAADADVANAPTYTGEPPSTYVPRPAPSGGYTSKSSSRSTSSGNGGSGSSNGGGGGVAPTTATATTMAPVTPTTVAPPPTTTPPTTKTPPTTSPPTTTPPTTKAPPTVPPTTSGGGTGG